MTAICSRDISVVLQGPVRSQTHETVESIRVHLPDAEIVFSTWQGEDTQGILVDKIVRSVKPESFIQHKHSGTFNNLNCLIRSTRKGLEVASRAYILKMRSDLVLDSVEFLNHWDKFPKQSARSVLKHKVIVPALFSRIAYRNHPTPFHISDWCVFGTCDDVQMIFDALDEVKEPEFTHWFAKGNKKSPFGTVTFRMAPEQYICYSFFRRHFKDVEMRDCSDCSTALQKASDEFVIGNYIILEYKNSGFRLPKYSYSTSETGIGSGFLALWNKFEYRLKYKALCDQSYCLNEETIAYQKSNKRVLSVKYSLNRHKTNLRKPRGIRRKCEDLVVIVLLSLKLLLIQSESFFKNKS